MSKRPCHCGTCNRCVLFETNREINLLWGGDGKVRPLRPGEGRAGGPTPAKPAAGPCVHLGDEMTGRELDAAGLGHARKWALCLHPTKPLGPHVCGCKGCGPKCPGYAPEPVAPPAPIPPPEPPPSTGIVVGTYGLPQLARLQVLLIRETCGAVPILFADDGAEADHPGTDAAFLDITDEFPGVTYWPSAERRGHYAGDLSVFWKGLQWAERDGLRWLCKLSQRFLWTRRDWLADAVRQLAGSGLATMYQGCIDDGIDLYVRSECVLMDAAAWRPHARLFDRPRLHSATEFYVNDLVHRHFGGRFERWREIPIVREVPPKAGAFVWHTCHGDRQYAELHKRYGVPTDQRGGNQSMTAAGWMAVPNWKKG